ncbi:hypothetical protein [Hymenobacter metallilatus]|uniref:Uncharacterized protein n=1 Tax=Hymenobacter metallilatus TaxID=2493666 RepID=A0A3R9M8R3_9BACT|nr:hypothetical protein [Hymenobacter metallilatus]RSK35314.1 hypothetical protein EI290_06345 [Hymenobacter metallilatus]
MQTITRRFLSAALLLVAMFSTVHLLTAYWRKPNPVVARKWSAPRLLLPDSVVYGFVRELLAQSDTMESRPNHPSSADFHISRVLFENNLWPAANGRFYSQCPQENGWWLWQLCEQDPLLTPADTVFMRQQMRFCTGYGLHQRFIPGRTIIPADTVWTLKERLHDIFEAMRILRQRHHTSGFSNISAPQFSVDHQTVIVEISSTCGGGFCGGSETWLLQKRGRHWHKIRLLSSWVS